jgi:LPXTG-motif cell wall-anchored protein
VEGHTKSIAKAEQEIASGSHPEVKAFATDYLPKARMHLQHSEATQAALASADSSAAPDLPRTGTGTAALAAIGAVLASLGLVARPRTRR